MDAGNDIPLVLTRSWAARIRPTASASKTVWAVALPRWNLRVALCTLLMNKDAAAPTWPLWHDPSVNTIVSSVHRWKSLEASSLEGAMSVVKGVSEFR